MPIAYAYALGSVLVVSLLSFVGVFALSLRENILRKLVFFLVALAVGALFGDAFIHLIPEAFAESGNPTFTSVLVIVGILIFFIIEKFLNWHHTHGLDTKECRDEECEREGGHVHPTGYMILVSDGFHNLLDGLIIGASYLVSVEVGIATTIAVILHEIPQEFGDFGVLLHSGFSRGRALFMNFLSALFAIVGALIALWLGTAVESIVAWIIPIAAGGFIYIAGSDLIPELQNESKIKQSLVQLGAVFLGVLLMFGLLFVENGEHGHAAEIHDDEEHELIEELLRAE